MCGKIVVHPYDEYYSATNRNEFSIPEQYGQNQKQLDRMKEARPQKITFCVIEFNYNSRK